jgi:two-component system sensor histidine kinase KdpD
MAERLQAEWIVAFVETPAFADAPADVRDRVLAALRLAEQLGAETVTLNGERAAEALLHYARSRNVSKIVIGKQQAPLWKRLLRGSVLDKLIEASGDIEIYAISGEPGPPLQALPRLRKSRDVKGSEYLYAGVIIAVCTAVSVLLRSTLNPVNLVMFYLLGIVSIAMRSSRRVAFLSCLVSVAAFDLFCVPPYLTFSVVDYEYVLTFAVMLIVAVTVCTLTIRVRAQAMQAVDREGRTQALYRLTKAMTADRSNFDTARVAAEITEEVFNCPAVIFLPDTSGKVSFIRRTSNILPIPRAEEGVAQWAFEHKQLAGLGTDTLPGSTALYVPLRASRDVFGVMAVLPRRGGDISPERIHMLEVFASQIALAMERSRISNQAKEAELRVEAEQTRNALLSAVSHDLRTPLASITGAATTLLSHETQMDQTTRHELLDTIAQEAQQLSRLVNNLLDMTRLESGVVELHRDWHSLEEIVGTALNRVDTILGARPVRVQIPEDLPFVLVDDVLIGQVFVNLLENAAKYSPENTDIVISAAAREGQVIVEVADRGPGFTPEDEKRIWEKFYRGAARGTTVQGAGLGLAICRAIVSAHAGTIQAENRAGGGALIRVVLPTGGPPPQVDLDE